MHHWTVIDCTYLYDGSLEGILSVVYTCLKDKQIPNMVIEEENYVGNLFEQPKMISTNLDHSSYILEQIQEKVSDLALYYVYTSFLSSDKKKANALLHYIIYAFKYGFKINQMKSIDCVIEVQRIAKNVKYEAHRFSGFIRFKELENKFLYAEYESDNDILTFLADHFSDRLQQEIWMIHDKTRFQIALYNRDEYIIVDSKTIDLTIIESDQEDYYLQLWKDYFKNITIKERENRRCQRSFMPKKYWKYLPETKG
ncbi:putative DNA metabolism protein [Breznakia sp. PF5-3]|uniref:TIGR03915 family putative DNA repair protein n=1 Tax=unclassified Breznakia TaxID=2623764 RepID=UPI00240747C2|nr:MULTISPECIES: TIGR03915 family putative DNA repair protein [unclassified Breznakia]MDF9825629.1 putative DNA metabolism protein [Breznakia sp. PM6-1]MDF9836457.1 putative DNA metabolism protein [Breznakia sp. PF5-3]MDF9838630.1 putative DNA metabolism protein [Breznakia sp. PFB2-8]MDF9860661.1 putative DNA metabolism protein [Breznakia sp. PH5-24]